MSKRKETKRGLRPLFLCLHGDLYSIGAVRLRLLSQRRGRDEMRRNVLDNFADEVFSYACRD